MLIVPIMILIGIVNDNNLWLYLALGLSVLSHLFSAADQKVKQIQTANDTADAVDRFVKSLQSKLN